MLIGPLGINFNDFFFTKYNNLHSRKCVLKCRPQRDVRFVSASMCQLSGPLPSTRKDFISLHNLSVGELRKCKIYFCSSSNKLNTIDVCIPVNAFFSFYLQQKKSLVKHPREEHSSKQISGNLHVTSNGFVGNGSLHCNGEMRRRDIR